MSKFFCLCKTNIKKHGLRGQFAELKIKKVKKPGSYYFGMSIFLLCLIFFTVGFYIFQITSSVADGFKISDQEKKLNQLKLANERMTDQVSKFEDLGYIKGKAVELGLVSVEKVEYLEVDGGVALK